MMLLVTAVAGRGVGWPRQSLLVAGPACRLRVIFMPERDVPDGACAHGEVHDPPTCHQRPRSKGRRGVAVDTVLRHGRVAVMAAPAVLNAPESELAMLLAGHVTAAAGHVTMIPVREDDASGGNAAWPFLLLSCRRWMEEAGRREPEPEPSESRLRSTARRLGRRTRPAGGGRAPKTDRHDLTGVPGPVFEDVVVTAHAVVPVQPEIVSLVASEAALHRPVIESPVEGGEIHHIVVAPDVGTGSCGIRRHQLLVRIVAGGADLVMRLVGNHLHEGPHGMTGEALVSGRRESGPGIGQLRVGLHHRVEGVTRHAVNGEVTHISKADLYLLVAPGLRAGLVRSRELVHPRGMALDAPESLEIRIVRLEVRPVSRRSRDQGPLLGIAIDVARGALVVGDLGMVVNLFRILHHLGEGHLGAAHEGWLVARLAP